MINFFQYKISPLSLSLSTKKLLAPNLFQTQEKGRQITMSYVEQKQYYDLMYISVYVLFKTMF